MGVEWEGRDKRRLGVRSYFLLLHRGLLHNSSQDDLFWPCNWLALKSPSIRGWPSWLLIPVSGMKGAHHHSCFVLCSAGHGPLIRARHALYQPSCTPAFSEVFSVSHRINLAVISLAAHTDWGALETELMSVMALESPAWV